MKKKDRQMVFDKYGGHCAYCGCDLEKGWHVDHVEPIRRKKRFERGGYYQNVETSERVPIRVFEDYLDVNGRHMDNVKWVYPHWVDDGCALPERDCIENMMPSCPSCNINKHGDTIEEFRASIAGYLNSLNLRMVQYKMVKKYSLVEETGKPVVFFFETYNSQP